MKLIGSGNKEERSYYIFEKDKTFFSLFPKFLLGCGFENLKEYEDYQEKIPDINTFENKVENFKNQNYDIDIVFTHNRIIIIIRTKQENKKNVATGIQSMLV